MTPLDRYREKRDFDKTPEPAGELDRAAHDAPVFVIQKHAASRLHYDFRLEIGGVLASWAVPKGPSLDPHDKRLAMHVEDHPMEYGSFEGTIPQGEYGGGTVMLWDTGTYEPELDMPAGLLRGELKFTLHGTKLQGSWALVRIKPRPGERQESWLLIKHRDEHARPHDEYDVVTEMAQSTTTRRTLAQIADGQPPETDADLAPATPLPAGDDPVPDTAPMQLATLAASAPSGPEWIHEIKYDGYRARIALENGSARVLTRTGADWTERFAPIAAAVEALPLSSALIDGEIVALGPDGVSDFGELQKVLSESRPEALSFMAFDLLHLNGHDLRERPLIARKELLGSVLELAGPSSLLHLTEHVVADGHAFHHEACELRLEGAVSKRADRPYLPGRSRDWLKTKCLERQEFVVVGWTEPAGARKGFGALLLGVYDGAELRYAGRVGTGFTQTDLEQIAERLEGLATDKPALDPPSGLSRIRCHWVRPKLVVEVAFREWTRDGLARQASFKGLRADKPAEQVVRETTAYGAAPESPAATPDATVATVAGVRITKPDKVLYPSQGTSNSGITKLQLARYYEAIAPHMMPHLAGRPLTLVRCPHGAGQTCFYQKHPDPRGFPDTLKSFPITEHGKEQTYLYAEDLAGLESLVQLGVLEVHAWNSMAADPEHPDRIVFDLDPGVNVAWPRIRDAALLLRDALAALGLASFVKSTGGKGLHVIVPIEPRLGYEDVRRFARAFVDTIEASDPAHFTASMSLALRPDRVFIDYLRNAHGATAVVAFSTRARDGAPVGVPLSWDELAQAPEPISMAIDEVLARVSARAYSDPWAEYEGARVELSDAMFAALDSPRQAALDEPAN